MRIAITPSCCLVGDVAGGGGGGKADGLSHTGGIYPLHRNHTGRVDGVLCSSPFSLPLFLKRYFLEPLYPEGYFLVPLCPEGCFLVPCAEGYFLVPLCPERYFLVLLCKGGY